VKISRKAEKGNVEGDVKRDDAKSERKYVIKKEGLLLLVELRVLIFSLLERLLA
jgi:hypothetical protein